MSNLMLQIKEGMTVFDQAGEEVGTVDDIYLGDEDLNNRDLETNTAKKPEIPRRPAVDAIASALNRFHALPEEMRARLERYGFFTLDSGLLSSTHYVMATQVAAVDEEDGRIDLNIPADDIIKV